MGEIVIESIESEKENVEYFLKEVKLLLGIETREINRTLGFWNQI